MYDFTMERDDELASRRKELLGEIERAQRLIAALKDQLLAVGNEQLDRSLARIKPAIIGINASNDT